MRIALAVLPDVDLDDGSQPTSPLLSFSLLAEKLLADVLGYIRAWTTRAIGVPPACWLVHGNIFHHGGPPVLVWVGRDVTPCDIAVLCALTGPGSRAKDQSRSPAIGAPDDALKLCGSAGRNAWDRQ
jgi:hypothetical protein